MLRKLGRQLTILNVVISGAILIAMAALALGVTERMMAAQNEKELRSQMEMALGAIKIGGETSDDLRVRLAMPAKYAFYAGNSETRSRVLVSRVISDADAADVLPSVREKIERGGEAMHFLFMAAPSELPEDPDAGNVLFAANYALEEGDIFDPESSQMATPVTPILTAQTKRAMPMNVTLEQMDSASYRVAVTSMLGEGQQDVVMVMQDRSEELHERNRLRWMFGGCVLFALALIVLSSLFFSAKAVAPVEAVIKKQREFVAAASHELRTPIASVRANAEVLGDAQLGEYAPYLHSILGESEKMTRLVSDLLSLARLDAKEQRPPVLVDAADVATDVLRMMAPLAEQSGLTLQRELHAGVFLGDADRLRQVLVALIDNAVRYTPAGGTVCLRTEQQEQRTRFLVEDSGPGIPDEHKQRAFERFYRTDGARSRDQGGSGLGLSIAKELVESMGGKITLGDRPGGGCLFLIEFPRAG